MMQGSKIERALHDPAFMARPGLFQAAVVETAMKRGMIELREAPNGTVFLCDKSGAIFHGLL